jgi:hypothetical protein
LGFLLRVPCAVVPALTALWAGGIVVVAVVVLVVVVVVGVGAVGISFGDCTKGRVVGVGAETG